MKRPKGRGIKPQKGYALNKIIPFPGVSFNPGDSFQNMRDGFHEDTEAPEVRGLPQSDSFQNDVEKFLREMGYVEK